MRDVIPDQFPPFEQYVATRKHDADGTSETCICCGDHPPMSADGYCEACIRYQFGYDEAQWRAVHALLGGAVRAALEEEVSHDLIMLVVVRAIREWHGRQEEAVVDLLTRQRPRARTG